MRQADKIFVAAMAAVAIAIFARIVLLSVEPAHAAEASPFKDPACPTVEEVVLLLTKQGETVVVLQATDVLNVKVKQDGRVIMATAGGHKAVIMGFEKDACVVGPIGIAEVVPETAL